MIAQDKRLVTKANQLVEASYRLNVNEQRIMALLVSQIHPADKEFQTYRLEIAELQELLGTSNRKIYAEVKDLTRGLIGKVVQIEEDEGPVQFAWLASAKYLIGEGAVLLRFAPDLKPYLLKLQKRFTSYRLGNVVQLRSRYSVRLYEILKQFEGHGTRDIELAELRKMLGLTDEQLASWKDFRRNVLEVAHRELPKKTDLGFDFTAKKRGRAVFSVTFRIWPVARNASPKRPRASATTIRCWTERHGSCGAVWENHSTPNKDCHYCPKFEIQRKQLRLFSQKR